MELKVLVKKEAPAHSSETLYDIESGNKFKVVSENGNAYSHLRIYVYTNNGDIACVATEYDIPNYEEVNFMDEANERLVGNKANLVAAEEYIKKVWEH